MLAALHGQVWNASNVSRSLSLSHPTVNSYLDYLEGAFLVRRLRPFHANIRKRLVKSPKIYWRDSGLLHALVGIDDLDHLFRQPWVGASWEGFVIDQVIGLLEARGQYLQPFFFRTYDGQELDLLLDFGHERWALEVKLTSAPSPQDFRALNTRGEELGAARRFLVTRNAETIDSGQTVACNLEWLLKHILS
jgi:predicted AAA+ superfamily ATPase